VELVLEAIGHRRRLSLGDYLLPAEQRIGALIIGSAVFFNRNRDRLIALSARHRVPAVFNNRDFTAAGGLISYGADTADSYRQAGLYVGRILKGDKPADLPVMQPVRFELVINLKTAKTLGLTHPAGHHRHQR
jgi:ABC-type uncharacterized transport system substrate-binding protein